MSTLLTKHLIDPVDSHFREKLPGEDMGSPRKKFGPSSSWIWTWVWKNLLREYCLSRSQKLSIILREAFHKKMGYLMTSIISTFTPTLPSLLVTRTIMTNGWRLDFMTAVKHLTCWQTQSNHYETTRYKTDSSERESSSSRLSMTKKIMILV